MIYTTARKEVSDVMSERMGLTTLCKIYNKYLPYQACAYIGKGWKNDVRAYLAGFNFVYAYFSNFK